MNGLIISKFEPLHLGHEALINFAKSKCDILYLLLCINDEYETIPGKIKLNWLLDKYKNDDNIIIKYTDKKLPYTSVSDREISKLWSDHIKQILPNLDIIFSSEQYGDYVAEYLNIKHIKFDENRKIVPISGTAIRKNPFKYWDYISNEAKPFFVKKICICGTESTGKSVLTEFLSKYYNTNYVKEWGRNIVKKSEEVTYDDIMNIGNLHAIDILNKVKYSNKILFSDTDINTTKMYSKYFFDKIPVFDKWIEEANIFDIHIFLNNDAPYIQDGTRLSEKERDELHSYHYNYLSSLNIKFEIVDGDIWENRTKKAIDIINRNFFNN